MSYINVKSLGCDTHPDVVKITRQYQKWDGEQINYFASYNTLLLTVKVYLVESKTGVS